jgi:GxxExxY protein
VTDSADSTKLNDISRQVIGAAIEVHRALGPGLLESTYEACLLAELTHWGLRAEKQKALPVVYRSMVLDCGYRVDLLVEDAVIAELKAIEQVLPLHKAQLASYLRLSNLRLGLLINFNTRRLTDGIYRVVNQFDETPRPLR